MYDNAGRPPPDCNCTLTPSKLVGRLPFTMALDHVSVVGERLVPWIVIQVSDVMLGWKLTPLTKALPGWKLAPFTTAEITDAIVPAPGDRVNTHAAPAPPLSPGPPRMAVFPSPDSATEEPW